jgi:hypothetical protein
LATAANFSAITTANTISLSDTLPGRKTRAGKEFSPFPMVLGPPIRTRPDFDIAEALKRLNDERMAREDRGEESEDERELEGGVSATPTSPSFPLPADSSLPDWIPTTPLSPPLLPHDLPTAPATASTSINPPQSNRTRKQQHAKDRRAWKRAIEQELEGRRVKSVTLKRSENMEALQVDSNAKDFNAASTGWIGGRIPNSTATHTLEEVTQAPYNLHHVKWDGK